MSIHEQKELLEYINTFWDELDGAIIYNTMEAATVLYDYMTDNDISDDVLLSLYEKVHSDLLVVANGFDWQVGGFVELLVHDIKREHEFID